ncbi:HK97-gp10 family putative phage morphogenesis protein [Pacificoceanicola onchidii]|uniref:HK97-gp10 family putative phage morphogenesis protein n=1 Tax=Pacificoceanicola onchidii TaxID=2562685 RepID=UPI0010A4481F|nr:HK97-gp10 family putative phage morphogenesis protein [Pacificoceanicola onchidii]
MRTSFKVQGFRDLENALMDLPKAAAKASVRRVLKRAAQPIADAGRGNAPERMGDLKASYGVGTRLTKRQRKLSRKESEVEVYAGPNDPGAIQTEFGNEHQEAEPHLRPAWDAHKGSLLDVIKEFLWADVVKAIARYQRRAAKRAKR